jgi:hypothetical protein
VQVADAAAGERHVAEEQRTAVSESRRVAAELVAGVRLCDGVGIGGQGVADQRAHAVDSLEVRGVQTELRCQRLVEHQQLGRGDVLGLPADGHLRKLTGKAVPEGEGGSWCESHTVENTNHVAAEVWAQTFPRRMRRK